MGHPDVAAARPHTSPLATPPLSAAYAGTGGRTEAAQHRSHTLAEGTEGRPGLVVKSPHGNRGDRALGNGALVYHVSAAHHAVPGGQAPPARCTSPAGRDRCSHGGCGCRVVGSGAVLVQPHPGGSVLHGAHAMLQDGAAG